MTNNNETTPATRAANLALFNPAVDLVQIRLHPEIFPRVGKTAEDEAIAKMTPLVYGAFLYRGNDANGDTVRFIATALVREIMNDTKYGLKTLSWLEVGMVIRNAVLGGAKELFGVSVATLFSALIDYARNEGHEAAKLAAVTPAAKATRELDEYAIAIAKALKTK